MTQDYTRSRKRLTSKIRSLERDKLSIDKEIKTLILQVAAIDEAADGQSEMWENPLLKQNRVGGDPA